MAKARTPRRVKKSPPKRATKVAPGRPWEVIEITDLHVSAATIDIVLRVLKRTREEAIERDIRDIICGGDFWDARNILSVRHVHRLMEEFKIWNGIGLRIIFIPGNHDQVSMNGLVHGVRVFEPFPNVTIANTPIHDEEKQIALLPWREEPADQAQMFADVPDGWTIFGHAEAPGALSNSGKAMPGRFALSDMKRARAVYLGHFHKRQQIGDNCWYIGNPFEKNFGEMGDPKGIAVIRSDKLEPEWIDFDEFPRHHRLIYPSAMHVASEIREHDIVEVYAQRSTMETAAYEKAIKKLVALDIRKLPIPDPTKSSVPAFAMGIDDAIEEYAASPDAYGHFTAADVEMLRDAGREILAQVPDAGVLVPLAKTVTPLWVTATDFCAIKGTAHLDLHNQGTMLLQGGMGVGKTSLCDAMTWAVYDKTTPRKAGSSGASLRADDVIHDDADEACVRFGLLLDDKHEVTIIRTKRRGKGSRVDFELPAELPPLLKGISDQQDQVLKIIGLPYALWRTCIYLGQGAVGNFITDADKKRKELLSDAFQLGACAHAQKLVRGWLKSLRGEMAPIEQQIHLNTARIETLEASDFSAEMKAWEDRRAATVKQSEQAIADAHTRVTSLDEKLKDHPKWTESEKQHTAHVAHLEGALTSSTVPERAGKIHAAIGAAEAEKSIAERDYSALSKSYGSMQAKAQGTSPKCPECGQAIPLETHEQHLMDLEQKIRSKQADITMFVTAIANHKSKLGELALSGGPDVTEVKRQLGEARETLSKVRQGLDAMRTIRAERDSLAKGWEDARATIERERVLVNPFEERQKQKEAQAAELQAVISKESEALEAMQERMYVLAFWEDGFGAKGVPVLVLRTVLHELEDYANKFLAQLTAGRVYAQLEMLDDDLGVNFFKFETAHATAATPRHYLQLSGGERRCAEMAFSPFALSEMIFSRTGVRVPMLVIDELTTHLSKEAKPEVCAILRDLGRDTVVVIDHDPSVQGAFEKVYEISKEADGSIEMRRAL